MKHAATTSVHVDANVVDDTDGSETVTVEGEATVAAALTGDTFLWKKNRLENAVGSLFNSVVV